MSELTLNDDNFEAEVLKSEMPVLVDFWAPWCGPCKILGPVIEELAKEYEGRVKVGKINVDDNPKMATEYGVMSIPTVILYKGGKVENQAIGAQPKEELVAMVEEALK